MTEHSGSWDEYFQKREEERRPSRRRTDEPTPDHVLTQDFWTQFENDHPELKALRVKRDGRFCDEWVGKALKALREVGLDKYFYCVRINSQPDGWLWSTHRAHWHEFLETIDPNSRKFIADGTAFQFLPKDNDKPRAGYFGFLEEAPPVLQEVYNHIQQSISNE